MAWKYDIPKYTLGDSLTMWDGDDEVYQVYHIDEFHENHAKLIVTAVNKHDELIDLVATLRTWLRHYPSCEKESLTECDCGSKQLDVRARKVLEGKSDAS